MKLFLIVIFHLDYIKLVVLKYTYFFCVWNSEFFFFFFWKERKFRDEPRPRFGLMRGREFIMKDMYTFDSSVENAMKSYELVCEAYRSLFKRLGIQVVQVLFSFFWKINFLCFSFLFPWLFFYNFFFKKQKTGWSRYRKDWRIFISWISIIISK